MLIQDCIYKDITSVTENSTLRRGDKDHDFTPHLCAPR